MRRLRPLAAIVTLLAITTTFLSADPIAVAPGVTVEAVRDPAGPWEVRVIRIDRAAAQVHLKAALGQGELSGRETTSGIVRRESTADARVVAAICGLLPHARARHRRGRRTVRSQ